MNERTKVILATMWIHIPLLFLPLVAPTHLHLSGFQVRYKRDYEKNKSQSDYNTLPATENPLLRQLRYAGTILSDVRTWQSYVRRKIKIIAGFFHGQ